MKVFERAEMKVTFIEKAVVATIGAAAITLSAGGNALGDAVSLDGTGHGRPGIAMAEPEVPYPAAWVNMAPGIHEGTDNLATELESSSDDTEVDSYSQGVLPVRELLAEQPEMAGEISSMEVFGDPCGVTGILTQVPQTQIIAGMPCPPQAEAWDSVPKVVHRDEDDPIATWKPPTNVVQAAEDLIDWSDRHDYDPTDADVTTEVTQNGNETDIVTTHEHSGIFDRLQGMGITLAPDQEAILDGVLGR